jgi:Na+-driven multidrug efflux pump
MGAEGEVHIAATSYLRTRSFEMIFTFLFCAFQAIRQAKGDTITPVILSTTSVVINIILTAYFIKGCGMGVEGAALATVIGQGLITPVCLFLLFRKKTQKFHTQIAFI